MLGEPPAWGVRILVSFISMNSWLLAHRSGDTQATVDLDVGCFSSILHIPAEAPASVQC